MDTEKTDNAIVLTWEEGVKDTTYRFAVLPDMRILQVRAADTTKKKWSWAVALGGRPMQQGFENSIVSAKAAAVKAAGITVKTVGGVKK